MTGAGSWSLQGQLVLNYQHSWKVSLANNPVYLKRHAAVYNKWNLLSFTFQSDKQKSQYESGFYCAITMSVNTWEAVILRSETKITRWSAQIWSHLVLLILFNVDVKDKTATATTDALLLLWWACDWSLISQWKLWKVTAGLTETVYQSVHIYACECVFKVDRWQ